MPLPKDFDRKPDILKELEKLGVKPPAKPPAKPPTTEGAAEPEPEPPDGWFQRLIWRRVPHWVGAYLAGAIALAGAFELLGNVEMIGRRFVEMYVVSVIFGIPAVFIVAHYHGRAGPQDVPRLEKLLLGVIVATWLAVMAVWIF